MTPPVVFPPDGCSAEFDSSGTTFAGAAAASAELSAAFPAAFFPVDAVMPELRAALGGHGRAVLTASPGSGKTTRVPLALLGLLPCLNGQMPGVSPQAVPPPVPHPVHPSHPALDGKILVLEPRRLAARSAARYMAGLLGEDAGRRVGYRVRLESKVSVHTRVELLTEGMFTRRLLADPELSGVSCVIFDEFHERGLQGDLGLALCLEAMEAFRPDLRLLVMSATLDAGEISRFLGGCPVIEASGSNWPVDVRYADRELAVAPDSGAHEIAGKIARAVREALHGEAGSVLVFLPGQAEIRRAAELLENLPENTDVYPLYGDLPPRVQDAALAPSPPGRRKVVLATDIAQTSLTIEGVRVVIDAGLARGPRFEPATGLSRLATARLARDAADQRAGRAGRLEPGVCLRLWSAKEVLSPQTSPEILDADLAPLYLDALAWGSDPAALPWLTPPPEAALRSAAETLLSLGAVEAAPAAFSASPAVSTFSGGAGVRLAITPHGRKLARLPLHPRLAHMVLRAAELEEGPSCPSTVLPAASATSLAACLAALISERDPLRGGHAARYDGGESNADIRVRLPLLRRLENKRLRDAAEQIHRLSGLQCAFTLPGPREEDFCGLLLALAWPERIAQRRGPGSFRLASGLGAELPPHDPLAAEPWLAAATLGGGVNRRVRLAAPLALADLLRLYGEKAVHEEEVRWDSRSETVVCRAVKRLGALVLEEKPLALHAGRNAQRFSGADAAPGADLNGRVKRAVLEGIAALGPECLPWTEELRQLQARVFMLRGLEVAENGGDSAWPDISDAALMAGLATGLAATHAIFQATAPVTVMAAGPDGGLVSGTGHGVGAELAEDPVDGGGAPREHVEVLHAEACSHAGPGAFPETIPESNPESTWLSPWLEGVSRRAQFAAVDLGAALRALLPWPLPERLEAEAPARLNLPSGSSGRVDYLPALRGEPPVLAVKLQEMFGQTDTPRVGGGRVPVMLHLLSPAGRPLQVTGDLRHFWTNAYKSVRAEMRGRYPKHPWPEDPLGAEPTGKTKKRLAAP